MENQTNNSQAQPQTMTAEELAAQRAANFKTGEKWAIIGVVGNLFLTLVKYIAGFVGNSSAMIADATHSASDIIASAVVFCSMKIAKKPRDKGHPYGHGGAEVIATMAVAIFLFLAGLSILFNSINVIKEGNVQAPGVIAFIAAIISIVTKEIMFRATYAVGKRINSPSLIANAWDHRSDVYSSIGTVIGIGGALLGFPILDPIAGAVVSLFILHMAWNIAKDGLDQIMSASCKPEVVDAISEHVREVDGVMDVQGIRAKQSGPYIMIDLRIYVQPDISITEAHDIAAAVRTNLFNTVEHTYDVLVHVEPYVENGSEQ